MNRWDIDALSPEEKKARSRGIGGSDVAPLLGLSNWKTPMDLWAEKIGHKQPEDIGDKEFVHFGIVLEQIVAKEFELRTGKKVRRRRKTVTHSKFDFMLANIDRDIVGESAGLECKCSSAWLQQHWGETGSDDFPLYYLTQCVHYMEVLGYDRWYCAVLIGGNEFRWYVIERSAELAASLIEKEATFWRAVLSKSPPEPVCFADMVTLYPKASGTGIVATDAIFAKLSELAKLNEAAKGVETEQERLKIDITKFMGHAGRLTDRAGGRLATWLSYEQTRLSGKRVKAVHPEIYNELAETSTVRPFRL